MAPPADGGAPRDAVASRVDWPGSRAGSLRLASRVLALAVLVAGCGSAAAPRPAAAPRGAAPRISPQLRREEQQIHARVSTSLHQLVDRNVRYGEIPSFIPHGGHPINRVLEASPRRPQLSIEGGAIRVRLPTGSSVATMIGPDIPRKLQGTAIRETPATLTLTFTRVTGAVPITSRAFTIVDEQGTVLRPLPRTVTGRPAPSNVPERRQFTVRFSLILPIGNGTLRYTPAGSGHFVAAWDFNVETD